LSVYTNIIIFIGPPGSGKGSLSHICVKDLGWTQLSTGNLCRRHITQNTPLGQKIDFAIKSGKLIEDSVVIEMVRRWLHENDLHNKHIILDGFPRTIAQAEALHTFLQQEFATAQLHIIKLDVSSETVIKRLTTRFICPNDACQAVYSKLANSNPDKCNECNALLVTRSDDTVEAIKERLALYYAYEPTLLDYYKQNVQFIGSINVEQPLDNVFQDFRVLLQDKVLQ